MCATDSPVMCLDRLDTFAGREQTSDADRDTRGPDGRQHYDRDQTQDCLFVPKELFFFFFIFHFKTGSLPDVFRGTGAPVPQKAGSVISGPLYGIVR